MDLCCCGIAYSTVELLVAHLSDAHEEVINSIAKVYGDLKIHQLSFAEKMGCMLSNCAEGGDEEAYSPILKTDVSEIDKDFNSNSAAAGGPSINLTPEEEIAQLKKKLAKVTQEKELAMELNKHVCKRLDVAIKREIKATETLNELKSDFAKLCWVVQDCTCESGTARRDIVIPMSQLELDDPGKEEVDAKEIVYVSECVGDELITRM